MAVVAFPTVASEDKLGDSPRAAGLYIADLDGLVSETTLYDIFNAVAPVTSVRICSENQTRNCPRYAYVNFHSRADAQLASDLLNNTNINGRPCRIMWSLRCLCDSGSGNVFVKHLDKSIDERGLYDIFCVFGNILACKVNTDAAGKSKGYGFVHFESTSAADRAIKCVNGLHIKNRIVWVGRFVKRHDREKSEVINFTNLYLKNFPENWEERDVITVIAPYGKIKSLAIMRDKMGHKFAFVNVVSPDVAKRAIDGLHCSADYRTIEEIKRAEDLASVPEEYYKLYCQRAQSKLERLRDLSDRGNSADEKTPSLGVNLYVKNLHHRTDDKGFYELFAPFGNIVSAKVMLDERGRSKGFGFVCFKLADDATNAVCKMHLKIVDGKLLYVDLAEKREERRARLAVNCKSSDLVQMMGRTKPINTIHSTNGSTKGRVPQFSSNPMSCTGQMPMQESIPHNYGYIEQPVPDGMMNAGRPMEMAVMRSSPLRKSPHAVDHPMNMAPYGQCYSRPVSHSYRENEALMVSAMAADHPAMQKQMLGEHLFSSVSTFQSDLAGKLTGMILGMDNIELVSLLNQEPQLKLKVCGAVKVIEAMSREQYGNIGGNYGN